jgi:GH43 family beta-xylosidase
MNPVWDGSMPDPFVLRHRGVYYAFGTTGPERKRDGRIFTLLRSTNLYEWEELGGALTPPAGAEGQEFWAPEVAERDGTFFMYYSMGGKEPHKLRIATSDKPEGPYKDLGIRLLDPKSPFTIDAHPFRDDDGTWYLFYARDFLDREGGAHPGTAVVVDRLVDMTKLAGESRTVLRAHYEWTLFEANRKMPEYGGRTFNWHTIEGPVVTKRDGRYYCFYSGSNYQTERYGVDYAVASSVVGPYSGAGAQRGPRVLKTVPGKVRGPGHHSFAVGPDGKTEYIVYHAWDPGMKARKMCIDKMAWTPEGPRCLGPTWTPQEAPAPGD